MWSQKCTVKSSNDTNIIASHQELSLANESCGELGRPAHLGRYTISVKYGYMYVRKAYEMQTGLQICNILLSISAVVLSWQYELIFSPFY